jgi:hypothetical protein
MCRASVRLGVSRPRPGDVASPRGVTVVCGMCREEPEWPPVSTLTRSPPADDDDVGRIDLGRVGSTRSSTDSDIAATRSSVESRIATLTDALFRRHASEA